MSGCRLEVVGSSHGDEAEEHDNQHISPAQIGEAGGVQEGERHAHDARAHQLPSTVCHPADAGQQGAQPDEAGGEEGDADTCGHCPGRYPSLCAGTFGTQAVFAVASFAEIVQVVDKVCRYLHHSCKEQA